MLNTVTRARSNKRRCNAKREELLPEVSGRSICKILATIDAFEGLVVMAGYSTAIIAKWMPICIHVIDRFARYEPTGYSACLSLSEKVLLLPL